MLSQILFWETIPVFWLLLLSLGLSLLLCALNFLSSFFIAPSRNFEQKFSGYECGFDAFDDARMRFDVRYYLVAILFLLFDVEIVYLFPFVVLLPVISTTGFWIVEFFMVLVSLGFIFEYVKDALSWQSV